MEDRITRFFRKNTIQPECVSYVLREDGKTVLHLLDGRAVSTLIPLKEILFRLQEQDFLSIQKGIAVSAAQVADISEDGVYTMSDGRTFQGRRRSPKEHQENRRALNLDGYVPASEMPRLTLVEKCTVLDNAPMALCLIELDIAESGAVQNFIFRYVNAQMEEFEGLPADRLVGYAVTDLFENLDPKRLIAYADVALNGTNRVFYARGLVSDEPLVISCHQPEEGFCICGILKVSDVMNDLNMN